MRTTFGSLRSRGVWLAVALAVFASGTGTQGAEPASAQVVAASIAHPHSDPVWHPLRGPAKVACVVTNCSHQPHAPHGYWAIDLIGDRGMPIHAAGAGVFHVGGLAPGCSTTGAATRGTWVWVDHGGGVVSRYHHLDRVIAQDGELVDPSTVIGTVGSSGDVPPCDIDYLHFELRQGGVNGPRLPIGQLRACAGGRSLELPAVAGYSSWDDVPWRKVTLPQGDSSCVPATPATPDAPAWTTGSSGDHRATLAWAGPTTPIDRVTIEAQIFRPTLGIFRPFDVRTRSGGVRGSVFSELQNGRTYRFRVAFHDPDGHSAWGPWREVVPAGRPAVPGSPRWLTATSSKVRFAWWKSQTDGRPVSAYRVAIRQRTATGWTAWQGQLVDPGVYHHNWEDLQRGTTYEVMVRAQSTTGHSAWSPHHRITTPR